MIVCLWLLHRRSLDPVAYVNVSYIYRRKCLEVSENPCYSHWRSCSGIQISNSICHAIPEHFQTIILYGFTDGKKLKCHIISNSISMQHSLPKFSEAVTRSVCVRGVDRGILSLLFGDKYS